MALSVIINVGLIGWAVASSVVRVSYESSWATHACEKIESPELSSSASYTIFGSIYVGGFSGAFTRK